MKAFFAWMKLWARTGYEAVTRIEFYRSLETRKTGDAVGHLAMFAVLWTLPLSVMFFIGLRSATGTLSEGLRDRVPAGAVFEMKDEKFSNNLQEPLVFEDAEGTFIINASSSTRDLAEGERGMVIAADGIVVNAEDRQFEDYDRFPNFRISREELMSWLARWAPLSLFLGSLVTLVFMFLTFWSGFLLNALLHGFTLWLLLKVIKRPRPWRASFVAAAYAATAPIVLSLALSGLERAQAIPDIAYWGYIAWIAYDAYKGGTHERKETPAADRPHTEGESGPV